MTSSRCFRLLLGVLGCGLFTVRGFAETLAFADLKANEAIVVGYSSTGCFHQVERKYVVRGGDARSEMEVYEGVNYGPGPSGDAPGTGSLLLSARIDESELVGLDSYLFYLRGVGDGGCTTVDRITLGYYRNNVKIGEERLSDASCSLRIHWKQGKLVYPETERPTHLSETIYKSIVTFQLLEQRATEPTDRAGD